MSRIAPLKSVYSKPKTSPSCGEIDKSVIEQVSKQIAHKQIELRQLPIRPLQKESDSQLTNLRTPPIRPIQKEEERQLTELRSLPIQSKTRW